MNPFFCSTIAIAGLIMLFRDYNLCSVILMKITFVLFIRQNKESWKKLPFFGVANLITTIRFILILALASGEFLFYDPYLYVLVLTIPLLDIIDGLVARYRKEESQFGMYYDMEVDALFVMVASIIAYLNYPSMWIVLVPAFLRYFYKFAIDIMDGKNKFIESKQKYASIIAGNYFVALIAFYILKNELASIYLILSSILIVFSFGRSFYDFYKWTNGVK